MEKLLSQQEQTLGILDTRIDAMMEKRTQAIMDRLDGLLGNRSGSRNRENSIGSREWTSINKVTEEGRMDPREVRAVHPAMPQGIIGRGAKYQRRFYWQQTDLKRKTDAGRK